MSSNSIRPAAGTNGVFIDKRTANVVRREYVEKGRRYTVTFDDYRTFDGIPEPSHVRSIDSYGNERDLTLLSRTLDLTPDPHDVDIASSRRALVEFPLGVTTRCTCRCASSTGCASSKCTSA